MTAGWKITLINKEVKVPAISNWTHVTIQRNLYKTATQKIDKTKILISKGSLMKVESIAECPPWSILQYF